MKEIKYVRQEDEKGCVPACFAMILGKDYSEIKRHWFNDFKLDGLSDNQIKSYLDSEGLAFIVKEFNIFRSNPLLFKSLKPFADAHILSVKVKFDSNCHHCIVMDANGNIFDPHNPNIKDLDEYYDFYWMLGVYYDDSQNRGFGEGINY